MFARCVGTCFDPAVPRFTDKELVFCTELYIQEIGRGALPPYGKAGVEDGIGGPTLALARSHGQAILTQRGMKLQGEWRGAEALFRRKFVRS